MSNRDMWECKRCGCYQPVGVRCECPDVPHQRDSGDEGKLQAFETVMAGAKPSNPKDALGIAKVPASVIPATVLGELGIAMMEGALKYGRHNYRVIGVRASVYYDAVMARHMPAWWEGEDTDADSDLSHITKAISSLVVLRDAMIRGTWIDDRPPPAPKGWLARLNEKAKALLAKYPNPVPAYTAVDEQNKAK